MSPSASLLDRPSARRVQILPLCRSIVLLAVVGLVLVLAPSARADGGQIALRATSGPYAMTVFSAPNPLVTGPVDLSLLVEDAGTGEVMGDAAAAGTLTRSGAQPIRFLLTHGEASNKLLLAATPVLSAAGSYMLRLDVSRPGNASVSVSTTLVVAADHRRRTTLLMALLVPFALILLFLVNQQAKRQVRLRQRMQSPPALH